MYQRFFRIRVTASPDNNNHALAGNGTGFVISLKVNVVM